MERVEVTAVDRVGEANASPGWTLSWTVAIVLLLAMAFGFQGSRGVFDPDEGFYSNVAMGMVQSGDWWLPQLNGDPFLDKPPILYWGIASGVAIFGASEWAARLVQALWLLAAAIVVGAIAAQLWGRRFGPIAALGYGLTLLPFAAGSILTPDTALVFGVTLAALAYWRWMQSESSAQRWGWSLLFGLAVGFGAMAKGPAVLLVAAAFAVHMFWTRGWRSLLLVEGWVAVVVALSIAGSWYVSIGSSVDGAVDYWLHSQVSGRLWDDAYNRNAFWWGSLKVYFPAVVFGALPWTPVLIKKSWQWLRRDRSKSGPWLNERRLFLLLWFALPMAVLLIARSRLHLYVLPIIPPLVLAGVRCAWPREAPRFFSRRLIVFAAVWMVALLGLKFAGSKWENYKDTGEIAHQMRSAGIDETIPVFIVDKKINGLRFYGYTDLTNTRLWGEDYPFFVRWPLFETAMEARGSLDHLALLGSRTSLAYLKVELTREGFSCSDTAVEVQRYGVLDCRQ